MWKYQSPKWCLRKRDCKQQQVVCISLIDLHCVLYLVILEVAKNDPGEDLCFERCSCCCGCTAQNSCCPRVLHEASMVHRVSSTRDCELQLKKKKKKEKNIQQSKNSNWVYRWRRPSSRLLCYSYLEKSKCCTSFEYWWWISQHGNKSSNFSTTEEQSK